MVVSVPTMIAIAPLTRHTLACGHSVSGHAQKTVLLVLWHIGGWPTTLEAVADLACASSSTAWRAINGLIEQGIVTRDTDREALRYVWKINEEALKAMAAKAIQRRRAAALGQIGAKS